MRKILLIAALLMLSFKLSHADCIINSTEFHKAYLDIPLVRAAAQNKYQFTTSQKEYLANENNPLDVKLAIINAFDWDHNGNYYQEFLNYLKAKMFPDLQGDLSNEEMLDQLSAEQIVLLAYLRAMDDIYDEELSYQLAQMALKKPYKNSQAFMLPITLIQTEAMSGDSDQRDLIYPLVEKQLLLAPIRDVRPEALGIVMEYMLYFK